MRTAQITLAVAALVMSGCGMAMADGYPPFYGYSGYFGGPRTYFTPENDVRSAATISEGLPGYGTRTYYRGGPFFYHRSFATHPGYYPRAKRRRVVLRARG